MIEVGKEYDFFDEGNINRFCHYKAKITGIISKQEAENIILKTVDTESRSFIELPLLAIWNIKKENHSDIYAQDTPYFIKAKIRGYDRNEIYFVKSSKDTWISMNIQHFWQTGVLDLTGELYKTLEKK